MRRLNSYFNRFHFLYDFERSIRYNRLVAVFTFKGLIVDSYQILYTRRFQIRNSREHKFGSSNGRSHAFFKRYHSCDILHD